MGLPKGEMFERAQVANVAQVYELAREVAAAFNDGDLDRWIALWMDDGIQMPPGAPRRAGKAAIQKAMRPQFDRFDIRDMAIQAEEIRILGEWAFAHGAFTFERTPKEGGETRRYAGSFLDVLARQVDGTWKIAIECFNYDAPLWREDCLRENEA